MYRSGSVSCYLPFVLLLDSFWTHIMTHIMKKMHHMHTRCHYRDPKEAATLLVARCNKTPDTDACVPEYQYIRKRVGLL